MSLKKLLLTIFTVVCLPLYSYSAINININSGNPTIPFPQFSNYTPSTLTYTVYSLSDPEHTATGLALHQPDGLSLAEMEQWIRDAWKIHSNEFYYADINQNPSLAGDVEIGPYQNATGGAANVRLIWEDSSPPCSEGHGYALLAAALMCDKDAFDGLWFYLNENGYFSNTKRYSTGAMFPAVSWGRHVPAWSNPLTAGTADSATDGDDDIAMAALLAWRQWGDNTGYYAPGGTGPLNTSNQPAIQYKQMAMDMMRFMVEKYLDSNNKYLSGDIGYDGYHKGGNTWNETTNWYTGPDPLEKSGPQANGYFDYAAPAYFHCFGTVLQAQGDPAWNYNQFFRGEASDDWLMGQLGTNPLYKNITAGTFSVNGTNATFGNANMGGEDFRTPMRTIINYLWHGNPTTSWDPASHSIVAGSNQHELNAAIKQARFMSDPQTYGTGVTCESYGYPVTFGGLSSWQMYNLDGTFLSSNWHIAPELAAPGAGPAVAAQNFSLMGDLFRDIMVQWDHMGGSDYYLNSVPHYFHGFFRQWGLMVLTGNMVDACHWDPKPNMRIFKAMDKTYSFPGETLKFWINYRNYGSVDATGVKIVDTLPAAFEYVSATDINGSTHGVAGQVVTWNFPNPVSGLHNQNYGATMGGVTLTVRVKGNAVQGRYCNFADISCANGTGSTSSPFPNNVSTIMCRNCVDIVSAALTITKTASTSTAQVGTTVTYTIDFCNSAAAAGWINGGRSGINFSFGVNTLPGTASSSLNFHLRANHAATEPAVDWANYRLSYFLDSPYTGGSWSNNLYPPEGFSGATTQITNELFTACTPTACSDATGSWNQRIMVQFGTFGSSIAAPTHMLAWKATSTAPNTYIHIGTQGYPFRGQFEITAGWNPQDWTNDWSQQEVWAVQTQSLALFPVSPDWTRGDGTSTIVTKINKDACQTATNQVTNILMEEWDGYTWRRVFGNGPMPGRQVDGVHVIDSLPAYLSFGGVISAPAGSTLTAAGKSLDWNIGSMQINQCGQIKYWARVLDPGCPGANGSVQTNIAFVKGDKEAPVSDSASVTILCGSPTNTPTFGASFTSTRTLTPSNTPSSTFTPTFSSTNTFTQSSTPTFTRTVTSTFSPTLTYTGSNTASPTYTVSPSPSLTQTSSSTVSPSHTPSVTLTNSNTYTNTFTPTSTRTVSPSLTVTDTISSNTPTHTQTSTNTFTATQTWTSSASPTSTVPTATFTHTNSMTASPTFSATNTYTDTYTPTGTYTATPTLTHSLTVTDTMSSNTPTNTPTWSNTFTPTQSWTQTSTGTFTPTHTDTVTMTGTPVIFTHTVTPTFTDTRTYTFTPTLSSTPTESYTFTATKTYTETLTATSTSTQTATPSATPTVTETSTVTPTPRPSPVTLDISLIVTGEDPAAGALVTYVILIENNTASPVNNVAVWDTLHQDMMFVSNDFEITPVQTGNYLYWDISHDSGGNIFTLNPGAHIRIEFTARINAVVPSRQPFTNTAMADYTDPFYQLPAKHPAIASDMEFYPTGKPVVFPNPFNIDTDTVVTFDNIVPGSLIQIYTVSGEAVKAIYAGIKTATWDSKNRNGKVVSPGIYYFVIKNQSNNEVKKGKIFVVRGN